MEEGGREKILRYIIATLSDCLAVGGIRRNKNFARTKLAEEYANLVYNRDLTIA